MRCFTGHATREPTNQREARGACGLRHHRLTNETRDVADEPRALALIGQLVGLKWASRGLWSPRCIDGLDRQLRSFTRRRHEVTRVYPFLATRRICRWHQWAILLLGMRSPDSPFLITIQDADRNVEGDERPSL